MHKLILLNDVNGAYYKRLKAQSDILAVIRTDIKCKTQLMNTCFDIFCTYTNEHMDDKANQIYQMKYKLEMDILILERQERDVLNKVKFFARQGG